MLMSIFIHMGRTCNLQHAKRNSWYLYHCGSSKLICRKAWFPLTISWLCVWCVVGVLPRFQQSFSYIPTVAACRMRRDSAWVLSATNTDAPCRRHTTQMNHSVTLSWHRANQYWLYPLNAWRLARKIYKFTAWCMAWPGIEPAIFRLQGEHSDHMTTQPVLLTVLP